LSHLDQLADQPVSVPVTLSDLEKRVVRGQTFMPRARSLSRGQKVKIVEDKVIILAYFCNWRTEGLSSYIV